MTIKLISRETEGEFLLDGRLDSNTSGEAETIFRESAERFDTVILNLSKLEYISSAGLRVLRMLHMTMKKKGGEMILRGVSKTVMEVFEMTGFVCLFKIET